VNSLPPPATLFTYFLALPHALPVVGETSMGFVQERSPGWDGWSGRQLADIAGQTEPFPPGSAPGTRIAIRHVEAGTPTSIGVAYEAFADWFEVPLGDRELSKFKKERKKLREHGVSVVFSVVALTRYVPRSEHPASDSMSIGWLSSNLDLAIADLNNLLAALALVESRWDIAILEPRGLHPTVPMLIESTRLGANARPQGLTTLVPLHDAYPAFQDSFNPQAAAMERAVAISNQFMHGDQPYMLAFRLINAAEAGRIAGDPTRGVIDLNTAVEVLVNATLMLGGHMAGWSEARVASATAGRIGLKRRVRDSLSDLLREMIDTNDDANPWGRWFHGGYQKRNAAVHEGLRLTRRDVDRARSQVGEIITWLRSSLLRSDELESLGHKLGITISPDPPWEEKPVEFTFPWDSSL
jgi:hypothetical protein